jgi:drug/metabolite transporter (DMT)-like permease
MVLKALKQVGASRLAIIECAYSPFVMLLSLSFLGEKLTLVRLLGAALVVVAIICVSVRQESVNATRAQVVSGMASGILGILTMAVGIVMVKPLFSQIPLFWVISLRLAAGVFASGLIFATLPDKRKMLLDLRAIPEKKILLAACVLSTYVSMTLWVAGYKFNDAALAAVLNQTSTIFTVVLAALILKEKFTLRKAAGTALAMTGVMIMAFL